MNRTYIFCLALMVSLIGHILARDPEVSLMHNRQSSLWYSNNFGASAEQHFPVLCTDLMTTRLAMSQTEVTDNAIGLYREDVDFALSGRVRQEGQLFDRPLTLRNDFNDIYAFTRSKLNLDFNSQYGVRTYGKPAAQMGMRLTAFSLWADPYIYTPILSEKVYFHATNFLKKAEIGEHSHRGIVPLVFLEEGWLRINFDAFLDTINYPLSIQVGTFPFIVGRGISLGDYFEGGDEYRGFERKGDIGNAPQKPNGLLITAGISDNAVFEFYYSKWQERSSGPLYNREEVNAKRLDRDLSLDPRNIERGISADTDIFAARLGCTFNFDDEQHALYVEPYAVFLNAPELKVEFDADSALRQGTFGVMTEYSYGNWSINCETAFQYGKQHMFPIDRNHLIVDDAYYTQTATLYGTGGDAGEPQQSTVAGRLDQQIGQPVKYHSHIFLGASLNGSSDHSTDAAATVAGLDATTEYLPYRAYYVSDEMQHINANRVMAEQGGKIRCAAPLHSTDDFTAGKLYVSQKQAPDHGTFVNGSLYSQYLFKTGVDYYDTVFNVVNTAPNGILFNANLPFGAQRRFRPEYTVTNLGVMGLLDVRYTLPESRMNFSAAMGYVGGDAYPFQASAERDKDSSHFMPLRDSNYVGRYVTSFVMFYPRYLPRPMEMSDNDLFAHNDYKTLENLQYVGVGSQWYPLASGTVMVEGNAICFWEVSPPHKWNINQPRSFARNSATDGSGHGKEDSLYAYIQQNELYFSGSSTTTLASKCLGLELNALVSWRPYDSLQFDLRAGIFIPGALYTDIQGCPNANTRRVDQKGDWRYDSLGTQMVSGGQARVTYRF
ncbi:MAG: hypothetical protein QG632_202 [Candidatus Dependentiae bacterium]|nr:hypothetical protein [Candidatus Dependentiae bacterium]